MHIPTGLRIDPERMKTVAFVCIKLHDGTMQPKGTAFFVAHKHKQKVQIYAVTAKHVLEGIREKTGLQTVFLSFNGA